MFERWQIGEMFWKVSKSRWYGSSVRSFLLCCDVHLSVKDYRKNKKCRAGTWFYALVGEVLHMSPERSLVFWMKGLVMSFWLNIMRVKIYKKKWNGWIVHKKIHNMHFEIFHFMLTLRCSHICCCSAYFHGRIATTYFNRNPHNLYFCVRAKDSPTQISQWV